MTRQALVTFVLPFFNEEGFIGDTIACLARQTDRRFAIVLVNNHSQDKGDEEARAALDAMPDIQATILHEEQPGKVLALCRGLDAVETPFVGTMDADTHYPPEYVARVLAGFLRHPGASAVLALNSNPEESVSAHRARRLQVRLFPRRCHTGGFGQTFRTQALREAGGFDLKRWPFVLEDHEIVHRLAKLGPLIHPAGHLCHTSDRRSDRSSVTWTMWERLLYKLLPDRAMDWFFYSFLARRFSRRGLSNIRLREQQWREDSVSTA